MMSQIHQIAPAFVAWIALSGGSHESDAIRTATHSEITLKGDRQGWEAATKRDRLVFGSNKAGDDYDGGHPP